MVAAANKEFIGPTSGETPLTTLKKLHQVMRLITFIYVWHLGKRDRVTLAGESALPYRTVSTNM